MAIKTFTTGEVLTAADTNTYLANSGLVFIKSHTVGSGVGSTVVTDAFSATYDNYLISYTNGTMAADSNIVLQFGSSVANYYSVLSYGSFLGGAINNSPQNAASSFAYAGGGNTSVANVHATVTQPFKTVPTEMYSPVRFGTVYGNFIGYHGVIASYTGFTLTANGTTFNGGTVSVYGYRKA